jgi:hypothetical protein
MFWFAYLDIHVHDEAVTTIKQINMPVMTSLSLFWEELRVPKVYITSIQYSITSYSSYVVH